MGEYIIAIKDVNGRLIINSIAKVSSLHFYYSSVFSYECSISQIQWANSYEPFAISTIIIRRRLASINKNESIGPDNVPGQILKLSGEAMILYLARLLDITISNAIIPSEWKRAIVVPIYIGGDRWLVSDYRPISSISAVSKQMKHGIASYQREVCEKKDRIFEGQ
jgi:hypothetical protein